MTTKEIVEHMLDKSETVGDTDYASRLIAMAQVIALASIADSLEKIAGTKGIVYTKNASAE